MNTKWLAKLALVAAPFLACGGGNGGVKGDKITIAQNTLSVAKY